MSTGPGRDPAIGRYAAFAQVGLEMAVPIGIGVLVDYQFGLLPWCTVGGAVIGFVGGLAHLIKLTRPPPTQQQPPEQGQKPP